MPAPKSTSEPGVNNFLKNIEKAIYKGQCTECRAAWPNEKTQSKTRDSLRSWRQRHMLHTGHAVRTAATYVRIHKIGD